MCALYTPQFYIPLLIEKPLFIHMNDKYNNKKKNIFLELGPLDLAITADLETVHSECIIHKNIANIGAFDLVITQNASSLSMNELQRSESLERVTSLDIFDDATYSPTPPMTIPM